MGRLLGLFFVISFVVYMIIRAQYISISKSLLLIYILLLYSLFSVYWSIEPTKSASFSIRFVSIVSFLTAIWYIHDTDYHIEIGLQALVLGGYVALMSTFTVFIMNISDTYFRHAAYGYNVNKMGGILALLMPVAFLLAKKHDGYGYWFNILFVPLAALAVLITASRGAIVALIPVVLLVIYYLINYDWTKSTKYNVILLTILSSVLAVSSSAIFSKDRFRYITSIPDEVLVGDISGRQPIWEAGIVAFSRAPIFGYGAGAYKYAVEPILGSQVSAHNSFISIIVELGVFGFALYSLVIYVVYKSALITQHPATWVTILLVWIMLSLSNTWHLSAIVWLLLLYCLRAGTVHGLESQTSGGYST
jgi:O-antigen ligase